VTVPLDRATNVPAASIECFNDITPRLFISAVVADAAELDPEALTAVDRKLVIGTNRGSATTRKRARGYGPRVQ